MKKQTLNEQVSRIKGMIKMNEDMEFPMEDQKMKSVEEVVDYITRFSSQIEELAEEFRSKLDGTDYWPYVNKMYSGIRSVSDMEGQYTRSDERQENVAGIIELIRSDYEMDSRSSVEDDDYDERQERNFGVDDEPSDDETFNGFGREGGIGYSTGDSWQGR